MLQERLIVRMMEFDTKDAKRIQHFLKVYEFAHLIGTKEGLEKETQKILEIAAILHDIGIHPSEEKYGRCDGKLQEQEGPAYARELLQEFPEVTEEEIERICYLIAHHHTYKNVQGMDHQILLEADFLVNAFEDELPQTAIDTFKEKVFETRSGIKLLEIMFG